MIIDPGSLVIQGLMKEHLDMALEISDRVDIVYAYNVLSLFSIDWRWSIFF